MIKENAEQQEVTGRFEWMREDVLAVVGGSLFYETPNMVVFRDQPLIWFERDDKRRLLLNMSMLTAGAQERTQLVNNDWIVRGAPSDVESPPNGSRLRVDYPNGDNVEVRFREWMDLNALTRTHTRASVLSEELHFPLVTAEITLSVGGTELSFGPKSMNLPGGNVISGMVASHCGAGLVFG